ncbi:hypothetical protein MRX96_017804 [Rhipicephalus microplus]
MATAFILGWSGGWRGAAVLRSARLRFRQLQPAASCVRCRQLQPAALSGPSEGSRWRCVTPRVPHYERTPRTAQRPPASESRVSVTMMIRVKGAFESVEVVYSTHEEPYEVWTAITSLRTEECSPFQGRAS